MNIFQLLVMSLMALGPALAAEVDLQSVLQIKPGEKLQKGLKPAQSSKTFVYEVELKKELVESLSIEFNPPLPSEKFLKDNAKGFCLIQPRIHTNLKRFFFFDMDSKRRYELNQDKKIVGILIQDIPGARANRECTFGSFKLKVDNK